MRDDEHDMTDDPYANPHSLSPVERRLSDEDPGTPENPYAAPRSLSPVERRLADDEFDPVEFAPYKTIWLHPRRTVRSIIARDPNYHVVGLIALSGIGDALDRASLRNFGDRMPLGTIIATAMVFGPLAGLFGMWISSHLLRLSGDWIGGIATREHLKTALAWSSVPAALCVFLWIPQLFLFGSELFTLQTPRIDAQPSLVAALMAFGIVEIGFAIWGLILLCNTVAEVQGFDSAWRGFGNLLLAALVVIIPVAFVVTAVIFAMA